MERRVALGVEREPACEQQDRPLTGDDAVQTFAGDPDASVRVERDRQKESAVSRIEPDTRQVVQTISVSDWSFPSGVVDAGVGASGVWLVNKWELTVVRLDSRTNKVVARIRLAAVPRAISVLGDAVWVSLAEPLSADPLADVTVTPAR